MKNKSLNKLFVIFAVLLIVSLSSVKLYLGYNNQNVVENEKKELHVLIYSKNACMYCNLAKEIFDNKNIKYEIIDLTHDKELHLKLAEKTSQNTVPYIYINDEFIGGYENLQKLVDSGKL